MRVAAKTVDDRLVLLLKFCEMLHAESFKQLQGLGMVLGGLAVHQRHVEKGGSRTFQLGVVTGRYGGQGGGGGQGVLSEGVGRVAEQHPTGPGGNNSLKVHKYGNQVLDSKTNMGNVFMIFFYIIRFNFLFPFC